MYYVYLWDRSRYCPDNMRIIKEYKIDKALAESFFILDSATYPILSELSYVDFDLYFGDLLYELKQDLNNYLTSENKFHSEVEKIISFVDEAINTEKSILFDPFRMDN
ncbi:hypothetical protein [Psychrobacter sp. I-STPA10]|uniref:hypothetical protein n=1 Tax=Psychrobacter sp. I-STPA10 TaxID=2585769 RepID=UPI001E3C81F6|nr:hypothetical protein [Psychrobacter sp. I-STPA10]